MIAWTWFNISQPRKKLQLFKKVGEEFNSNNKSYRDTQWKNLFAVSLGSTLYPYGITFAILNYIDIPIKTMYAAISAIIFAAHGELLHLLHSTCICSRTHTHLWPSKHNKCVTSSHTMVRAFSCHQSCPRYIPDVTQVAQSDTRVA
jgi:hypothetical protein